MPPAWTPSYLGLTAAALVTILAGCDAKKSGTETASATVAGDTIGREKNKGAIPITSASDEARQLYYDGRKLSEQLRGAFGQGLRG